MPKKTYYIEEDAPTMVVEPSRNMVASSGWNPNVPFHCTQEEFLEHIHRIEQGEFYPVEEVHQRVAEWLCNQKK
jgi:hypothetical protein